jgi:hypothetical protein
VTPDVNVLLAAFREDHVHHAVALDWLRHAARQATGGGTLTLLPMVVYGFIRIVTNGRVFVAPSSPADAIGFIDEVFAKGGELRSLGFEWEEYRFLSSAHPIAANDVTDAWIAAAVLRHGEVLATFDRRFGRLLPPKHLQLFGPAGSS